MYYYPSQSRITLNPYSHAVLAQQLQPLVRPQNYAEYLFGAIAPDIRYVAPMRREQTHLTDEEIVSWFGRFPGHESFIQGFRLHCRLDRIDVVHAVGSAFPFKLFGKWAHKKIDADQMIVVVELFFLTKYPQGLALAGDYNPILAEIGI